MPVWSSGLLDLVPDCIDHTYAGAAREGTRGAVLMRDVGPWLVPEGDAPVSEADHRAFLDHLAALHAAFWGWEDDVGLTPFANRFFMFSPWMIACEAARGFPEPVPVIARDGWARLPELAPRVAAVLEPLGLDPSPLVAALEATPQTLVHGDAKMGNLGRHPDGRTILIDWALPGSERRLPRARALPRAEPGADPRRASRRRPRSRSTGPRSNGTGSTPGRGGSASSRLALLGIMVLLGWEKALGPPDDLAWWEARVLEGADLLP